MPKLSPAEASNFLETIPGWELRGNKLLKTFDCGNFAGSISFVNKIAQIAQRMNHHPDIEIHWNKVVLSATTHDAGGLTIKDFALARECNLAFEDQQKR